MLTEAYSPRLSAECTVTDQAYIFHLINKSSQDVLIEYPFLSLDLVHNLDADGKATEDFTDTGKFLLLQPTCYYPLPAAPTVGNVLSPGQRLRIEIPFSKMGLTESERARDVKQVKLTIVSCPISSSGSYRDIRTWNMSHRQQHLVIVPRVVRD